MRIRQELQKLSLRPALVNERDEERENEEGMFSVNVKRKKERINIKVRLRGEWNTYKREWKLLIQKERRIFRRGKEEG